MKKKAFGIVLLILAALILLQGNWKIFLFNVDNPQLPKSHISTDNQGFADWG